MRKVGIKQNLKSIDFAIEVVRGYSIIIDKTEKIS